MGYDCGSTVEGNNLDELIESAKKHSLELHDYTEEEINSPEVLEVLMGAIKQSSRPVELRTQRLEEGRNIKPH